MNKQTQNQPTINTTKAPYVAFVRTMAGIRLSLLNSQDADAAATQAVGEFKPGDELVGVFGIDEAFVNQLEEHAAALAPDYAGVGSTTSTIPWLTISACPDGDVEVNVMAAPTEIAAAQKVIAYNATSGNQYRASFSLEPEILADMKKFLRDRQPVDIKVM